ncbi:uncharacterized protein TNCV_4962501 [Trichonephila clavipes]|nr:uncharacterized protein TNCV_4962501 [Trichonephila clavipes]
MLHLHTKIIAVTALRPWYPGGQGHGFVTGVATESRNFDLMGNGRVDEFVKMPGYPEWDYKRIRSSVSTENSVLHLYKSKKSSWRDREEITDFVQSIPEFQECDEEHVETWMACDAKDCGFEMLNGDEIVISVQEESDPVDDETDEDEYNNNNEKSKDPSNADAFSVLERQLWSGTSSSSGVCCPTQLLLLKRVRDLVGKNKLLISTIKIKLRHFAPILLFLQIHIPHVTIFNIRLVSGFIYCMDRIRFSVIRTIAYPNGVQSQLIRLNDILL